MKKTYTKPRMIFDSFEVAENIAACANKAEHENGECAVYIAGMPVFLEGVGVCTITIDDGSHGLCYYVPSADNSLFGS